MAVFKYTRKDNKVIFSIKLAHAFIGDVSNCSLVRVAIPEGIDLTKEQNVEVPMWDGYSRTIENNIKKNCSDAVFYTFTILGHIDEDGKIIIKSTWVFLNTQEKTATKGGNLIGVSLNGLPSWVDPSNFYGTDYQDSALKSVGFRPYKGQDLNNEKVEEIKRKLAMGKNIVELSLLNFD